MNFLQTGRISLLSVALNINTCFSCAYLNERRRSSFRMRPEEELTERFENFVAFIDDEMFDMT
jgi:hypothetical protein